MGNKRKRNHYPRLPDAVLNLLALHSLRAVPMKEQEFGRGAALGWMYNVIPDRPATPADSDLGRLLANGPVIFKLRANAPLEAWIKEVEMSLKRKADARLKRKADARYWVSYDFETAAEKRMYDAFRYACNPCGKKP